MQLMDRIYIPGGDFLTMDSMARIRMLENIRTIRTSSLAAAQAKSPRVTKSAIKNIAKNKGTAKGKKMLKDPTTKAVDLLSKLTPQQIAAIAAMMPKE